MKFKAIKGNFSGKSIGIEGSTKNKLGDNITATSFNELEKACLQNGYVLCRKTETSKIIKILIKNKCNADVDRLERCEP